MQLRKILSCLAITGLTAVVFGLSLVGQDRTQLGLLVGLVAGGSMCGLVLWHLDSQTRRAVLFYAVLFRLVLFHLPPSLSDDAYRYVWDGQVQVHGINPYQYVPQDSTLAILHGEPVYAHLNSQAFYSVYPPASQLVFRTGAQLFFHNWWAAHYTIKLLLVLAELLAVFLLARIVAARHLILYALNPLILLETAGQAHTESLLILLLVLAVVWHRRGRGRLASVALAAAGWVKLIPFFFLPLLWKRYKWRGIWPGLTAAAALALPFAAPYVLANTTASLDLYARYFEFNAGLYYAAKEFMRWMTGEDWSKQLGPLLRTIFLIGLPMLYVLDFKFKWSLPRGMLIITGSYLVLTTTVHPWYLVSVIALCIILQKPAWHWMWLGLCSVGTYLLYAGGPYWTFVVMGWGGWVVLGLVRYGPQLLQQVLRARALSKYRHIRAYISNLSRPLSVLDLGCAEGYVGQQVYRRHTAQVELADITDMNRSSLPLTLVAPDRLPWTSGRFDVVILYYVLHHAEHAESVAREALRVGRDRVIIVESVYESSAGLRALELLDKAANRLRSRGRMNEQERFLQFRKADDWVSLFEQLGGRVIAQERTGFGPFRKALFVVQPMRRTANAQSHPPSDTLDNV